MTSNIVIVIIIIIILLLLFAVSIHGALHGDAIDVIEEIIDNGINNSHLYSTYYNIKNEMLSDVAVAIQKNNDVKYCYCYYNNNNIIIIICCIYTWCIAW